MFIGQISLIPLQQVPALASPAAVAHLVQTTNNGQLTAFVDDSTEAGHRSGENITLGNNSLLLVAKDKDTMRRGLAYAGHQTVKVKTGSLYILFGHYSVEATDFKTKLRRYIQTSTPSVLLAAQSNAKLTGKRQGAYSSANLSHLMTRGQIRVRGYYVVLAPQNPLSAQDPASGRVYALQQGVATWSHIATLMNGGNSVGEVTPSFRQDKTSLYQDFVDWCNRNEYQKAVEMTK